MVVVETVMMSTMTKCSNSDDGDVYGQHAYGHVYGHAYEHDDDGYEMHGDDDDGGDYGGENDTADRTIRMSQKNLMNQTKRSTGFDGNDGTIFSSMQQWEFLANVPLKFFGYVADQC